MFLKKIMADKPQKNSDSIIYAILAVLAVFVIVTFVISMIALFNSGSQGPQGAPGAKGDKGDQGDRGLPGKNGTCSCPIPDKNKPSVQPININPLNILKKEIEAFISSLSDAQKQAILNSPQYDQISTYIKNLVSASQQNQSLVILPNYSLSQIMTWMMNMNQNQIQNIKNFAQDFYSQWMLGKNNFSEVDLTDQNVNYLISLLNRYMNYREYMHVKPLDMNAQEKIDLLSMLISNYPNVGKKILGMIFKEIQNLSVMNVNLKNFANVIQNIELNNDLKNQFDLIMQNDNFDDDVIEVSTLNDYNVTSNESYIFTGKSKRPKKIKVNCDANNNMDFSISNQGSNINLKLVFSNAKNIMVPNGDGSYFYVPLNQTRLIRSKNGQVTIS